LDFGEGFDLTSEMDDKSGSDVGDCGMRIASPDFGLNRRCRAYSAIRRCGLSGSIGVQKNDLWLLRSRPDGEALIRTEMAQTPATYRAFMAAFFVGWPPTAQHYVDIFSRVLLSGEYPRWARASA
jgi:hypothetical protein